MKKCCLPFLLITSCIAFAQPAAKTVVTDKPTGIICDNAVHNALPADATNRSPSDCEIQFDHSVRSVLQNAFERALSALGKDWKVSDTAIKTLTGVSKQSEKYFFSISYYFTAELDQQSATYQEWYKKYQAQIEELKNPKEDSYKKFTEFLYKMNSAIHIRFYIVVNDIGHSIYFLKSGQQTFSVPGAAYAVKGPFVAPLTGGGADDSKDAALILFGKPLVSVNKEDNGSTSVKVQNNFPKGISHLTVQDIAIRMECNPVLLNEILRNTDLKLIADLIGK